MAESVGSWLSAYFWRQRSHCRSCRYTIDLAYRHNQTRASQRSASNHSKAAPLECGM